MVFLHCEDYKTDVKLMLCFCLIAGFREKSGYKHRTKYYQKTLASNIRMQNIDSVKKTFGAGWF